MGLCARIRARVDYIPFAMGHRSQAIVSDTCGGIPIIPSLRFSNKIHAKLIVNPEAGGNGRRALTSVVGTYYRRPICSLRALPSVCSLGITARRW